MTEQLTEVSSSITVTKSGDFNRLPGATIMVQKLHSVGWIISARIARMRTDDGRAAASVLSNIIEGQARRSTAEFARLLSIAQGSLTEVQTQLRASS